MTVIVMAFVFGGIMFDLKFDKMYLQMVSRVKTGYKSASKQLSNRFLEAFLGDVLVTAEAHKKKGVKMGDQRYRILWSRVDERINQFCQQHQVSRADIEAQVPALLDLQRYAADPEPTRTYFSRLGIAISIPVGIFLTGLTSGAVQWVFHLGHHLIVR